MSAYHFKYFQNIQFKNLGIAPTPPYLPTLKAYPTPGVGGRFGIFSLKWRERMNLKVPGANLPLGCAILSTRARTVGGWYNPPLGELGLMVVCGWPPWQFANWNDRMTHHSEYLLHCVLALSTIWYKCTLSFFFSFIINNLNTKLHKGGTMAPNIWFFGSGILTPQYFGLIIFAIA